MAAAAIDRRLQGGQNFRSEGRRVRCPTPFIFRERGKVCRAALRNGFEKRHLFFVISGVRVVSFEIKRTTRRGVWKKIAQRIRKEREGCYVRR